MLEFTKYQHLEKYGSDETLGIDEGKCHIFPKIDGTNGQILYDGKKIRACSRNRFLEVDDDNHNFYKWVLEQDRYKIFFEKYPSIKLFGEWLVPHTLKTYQDTAWNNFYVFDVMINNNYLSYDTYKHLLKTYNIDYIPRICTINNPTYEEIMNCMEKNTFLIKEEEGLGEGIVIKNYDYTNKYGRKTWAKIVRTEFKKEHSRWDKSKETKLIEVDIVEKYVTKALVEKEYAKIKNETSGWSSKQIPRLLHTIYYCLVKEEAWNFVKDFKNPTINFKTLLHLTIQKTKDLLPQLF